MKRVDRLISSELVGPWFFGVAIFTVLIMAGTYLFRITDYIVSGISPFVVLELTGLLLPGIMAKTFPMALLLATLLAFGRLSGESEIVALKAAGVALGRMMAPVAIFGLLVALLAFGFNELIVPNAALRATQLQAEIASRLQDVRAKPTFYAQTEAGRVVALISAADFDLVRRTLRRANVVTFDRNGEPLFIVLADELFYTDENNWRMRGMVRVLAADGQFGITIPDGAWPKQIRPFEFKPEDILAQNLRDLDSFSMREIRAQIETASRNPTFDRGQLANLEFGYWNKIALPLAAIVFGLLGAPLGIRNHRTSAAAGFWQSVIIIFGYMILTNLMATAAIRGTIAPYYASFTPTALGLLGALILMHVKNR